MRELRKKAGMSQAELADIMGIQASAVSKYETGRAELSERHIRVLCSIFHTSADYLLGYGDLNAEVNSDGIILREAVEYGSSGDILKCLDSTIANTGDTMRLLAIQQRDVSEQLILFRIKIEEIICRLMEQNVAPEIISEATGISVTNIKRIIAGRRNQEIRY